MPHPHSHLQTGPATSPAGDPDWQVWSNAWTRHIPTLAGRSDETVTVAPGTGGGAPACCYPDAGRIGTPPTSAPPTSPTLGRPCASHASVVPCRSRGVGLSVSFGGRFLSRSPHRGVNAEG